jgi:hypothetical protein
MKNNFHLDIQTSAGCRIPFEEIMFLCSLKVNQVVYITGEVYGLEIIFSVEELAQTISSVIKIDAEYGQFSALSCASWWETSLTKAFDSILQQSRIAPLHENIN